MATVVVAGSSGLVGTALVAALQSEGTRVVRLVRRQPGEGEEASRWDPARGTIDPAVLEGADAVVNLAGVGVGDHRWTQAHKAAVLRSRVDATLLLASTVASLERRPAVLVSASASGYYGDRGDELLDESSGPGDGFLPYVCREWEAATAPAEAAGVRVAIIRSGIVLSARGGAIGRLLLPFRLGAGGPIGSGRQWWSWISIHDEVAAILHLMRTGDASGPFNLGSPNPVRNREFARVLGRVLHRPAVLPVPRFALRAALGDFADEELLGSHRMVPRRLEETGFRFGRPDLEGALTELLG